MKLRTKKFCSTKRKTKLISGCQARNKDSTKFLSRQVPVRFGITISSTLFKRGRGCAMKIRKFSQIIQFALGVVNPNRTLLSKDLNFKDLALGFNLTV